MWDLDLTQRAARRTEFYFRMLGDDPHDEPVGVQVVASRVHPDDLQRVESTAQAVIEGRRPFYEAEYRYRHADGSWRWLLDRGRVTDRDSSGKATRHGRVRGRYHRPGEDPTGPATERVSLSHRRLHGPGVRVRASAESRRARRSRIGRARASRRCSAASTRRSTDHGGWLGMIDDQYRPIALHARRAWRWARPRAARPRFTPCAAR